jgi:hypothetical protein
MLPIYLLASTPRAGKYNHRQIIPAEMTLPETIFNRIDAIRNVTGNSDWYISGDCIGVWQKVRQIGSSRDGIEILAVVVPEYDLSAMTDHQKKRLLSKLRELQPKLEKLVTETIDWEQNGATQLTISRRELNDWQQEIESFIPQPSTPKGNWIMRHKFLCVITMLFCFVISYFFLYGQLPKKWSGNKSEQNNPQPTDTDGRNMILVNPLKNDNPPIIDMLQEWRKIFPDLKDESDLKQRLNGIVIGNDLHTILNNVKIVFEMEQNLNNREHSKEDLLQDRKLRNNIDKLFPKEQFNPLGLVDRNNEKSPWFRNQQTSHEISQQLPKIREQFEIAYQISQAAEDTKQTAEKHKNLPEDTIIRFAKQLTFMKDGKDIFKKWQKIKELQPNFVTPLDIEMAEVIFKWLSCDDADIVFKRESPGSYLESVERFVKWKESSFTKKLRINMTKNDNYDDIPENQKLPDELLKFNPVLTETDPSQ